MTLFYQLDGIEIALFMTIKCSYRIVMDKIIQPEKWYKKHTKVIITFLLTILILIFLRIYLLHYLKTAVVSRNDIEIIKVERKDLKAGFSVTGKVTPSMIYQVETPVGGKIEKICQKVGDTVKKGDILVVLSNDDLQLQLINSETAVTDQINNLSLAKIQKNQSLLSQKRNLIALKQQITKKQRDLKNQKDLCDKKYLSQDEYQNNLEELKVLQTNFELSLEEAKTDSLMREQQILQMEQSLTQVRNNLKQMKNKIADLTVKASLDGQITEMELTYGQILSLGSKIAVIENKDEYYIQASINQYYLDRIKPGDKALLTELTPPLEVVIDRIHPKLSGDQAIVDFKCQGLKDVKSGQQVEIAMQTAELKNVLVISLGQYLAENNYKWVYVVDKTGKRAIRREIETGSRNSSEIEVLKGLEEGEEIIISYNDKWSNKQSIKLK